MKRIEGFSLIEMLITIVIIAVVMLLTTVTLTTLIKASASSSTRTTVREEGEFILELMKRTVRNSHTEDILVYDVPSRVYNVQTGLTEVIDDQAEDYTSGLGEGTPGTEIHFRPTGYNRWVCIGFFKDSIDETNGYILKSSALNLSGKHEDCFDGSKEDYLRNTMLLNSDEVDINAMLIEYFSTRGDNKLMTVDVELESQYLIPGQKDDIKPTIFRQAVISTQKLTWEK